MNVAAAPESPPHAPEAGWIRRLLGPFYVTGVFWYRLHKLGAAILPSRAVGLLMPLFAIFFFLVLRNIRAALAANLAPVLGPCGFWERQRRIFRTLWTFAWCLTERYERLATSRPFSIEAEGLDAWDAVAGSGQGFIVVTAHLGNWEGGSMVPCSRERRRVHVVREGETDPKAQEFVARLIRNCAGEGYVTHFAEDPRLGMDLLDALRDGEIVALQGDRPRAGGRTVEVSLFGRPFPLPIGPAALARAAEVALVPVFVFRTGRRSYRCAIRPPIEVAASGDRNAALEAAMRRFGAELEQAIRHRPHQWFCFRRLWRVEARRPLSALHFLTDLLLKILR